ncbi:hypothetical protein E3N88_28124 [Mikania micrantha]|uniref:Uncharacterized protein n=1 Tax=Mikania micrantha TaxID=192012 RepID=A0A5N6MYN1_9ASTR|nr:hypothetical protein E3N88_28124 [Mikania micrantha]
MMRKRLEINPRNLSEEPAGEESSSDITQSIRTTMFFDIRYQDMESSRNGIASSQSFNIADVVEDQEEKSFWKLVKALVMRWRKLIEVFSMLMAGDHEVADSWRCVTSIVTRWKPLDLPTR